MGREIPFSEGGLRSASASASPGWLVLCLLPQIWWHHGDRAGHRYGAPGAGPQVLGTVLRRDGCKDWSEHGEVHRQVVRGRIV